MYCHFMLADYITVAAAPLGTAGPGSGLPVSREQHAAQLLPAAAAALKPGACALYGACSPAQVRLWASCLQLSLLHMVGSLANAMPCRNYSSSIRPEHIL